MDLIAGLKFGAIFFGGMYFGCKFYSSVVEHPARLSSDTVVGVTMFKESFNTSNLLTKFFAILGTGCNIYLYSLTKNLLWLVSAGSLALSIPISFLLILPYDRILNDDKVLDGIDKDESKHAVVSATMITWGKFNVFTMILGLVSFVIPIYLVVISN